MKKGTRAAVIAAMICIVAGGILAGIGAAAGGREQIAEGDFQYVQLGESGGDLDDAVEAFFLKNLGRLGRSERLEDIADTVGRYDGEKEKKGVEVLNGDFERTIAYSGALSRLETKVGIHVLEIKEGSGGEILLKGKNCDRIQCYVEEGTLYIKDVGTRKKYKRTNDRELVLTVPAGILWEKVEMEAPIGGIEMDSLAAQKAELDAEMGNIVVYSLTADKLDIEANMGNVEIRNARAGRLEAEASMGNIEFEGRVDGDIEAEASMGSITLSLAQEKEEFNYEISAGMGSVTVDGSDCGGLSRDQTIDHQADKRMKLNSSMGSIDIYFE